MWIGSVKNKNEISRHSTRMDTESLKTAEMPFILQNEHEKQVSDNHATPESSDTAALDKGCCKQGRQQHTMYLSDRHPWKTVPL